MRQNSPQQSHLLNSLKISKPHLLIQIVNTSIADRIENISRMCCNNKLNSREELRQERQNFALKFHMKMRFQLINQHNAFHIVLAQFAFQQPVAVHTED